MRNEFEPIKEEDEKKQINQILSGNRPDAR